MSYDHDPEDGDRVTPVIDSEALLAMFREAGAERWGEESEDEQAHP